jgi:hypothetical protein
VFREEVQVIEDIFMVQGSAAGVIFVVLEIARRMIFFICRCRTSEASQIPISTFLYKWVIAFRANHK